MEADDYKLFTLALLPLIIPLVEKPQSEGTFDNVNPNEVSGMSKHKKHSAQTLNSQFPTLTSPGILSFNTPHP